MKTILIFGANSYLASEFIFEYAKTKQNIHAVVRNARSARAIEKNFINTKVHLISEIRNIENIIKEIQPDIILNTVCRYESVKYSLSNYIESNFLFGTEILSTASQLNKNVTIVNCDTALDTSVNNYSLTKRIFSSFAKEFVKNHSENIFFINLIIQTFYGPNDADYKFITNTINRMKSDDKAIEFTQGNQRRDFIYIKDLISAMMCLLSNLNEIKTELQYLDVEVGSGQSHSIKEVVRTLKALTQSKTNTVFGNIEPRKNEPMSLVANTSFLRSLNWQPLYDLETGLVETIKLRKHSS